LADGQRSRGRWGDPLDSGIPAPNIPGGSASLQNTCGDKDLGWQEDDLKGFKKTFGLSPCPFGKEWKL